MSILIVYNSPVPDASVADNDIFKQVEWLEATFASLSIASHRFGCTLNLEALDRELERQTPDVVFNLVESLAGTDALFYLPAELIEIRGIAMTGSSSSALRQLVSKSNLKQQLAQWKLPTAAWMDASGTLRGSSSSSRYIIKAEMEHASLDMDEHSIVDARTPEELRQQLSDCQRVKGRPCLAEQFVEGREFNLSLLDRGDGTPEVLPLAEIDFSKFPSSQPRIVGWKAKWDENSFEFHNTPRKFADTIEPCGLADQLRYLATECWNRLNLRGYARVDFRVSLDNQPWILEVNANPCLSPDAGFYAAAKQSGLTDQNIAQRILSAAQSAHARPDA